MPAVGAFGVLDGVACGAGSPASRCDRAGLADDHRRSAAGCSRMNGRPMHVALGAFVGPLPAADLAARSGRSLDGWAGSHQRNRAKDTLCHPRASQPRALSACSPRREHHHNGNLSSERRHTRPGKKTESEDERGDNYPRRPRMWAWALARMHHSLRQAEMELRGELVATDKSVPVRRAI